jgi:hypothetical protein
MRIPIIVATLALFTACPTEQPAPPPPTPPDAGAPIAAEPLPVDAGAIATSDAGAAEAAVVKPEWEPPLTAEEAKALDSYAGFSRDGLVLAVAQFSAGAGLPIMLFISTTTNTVEKSVAIESGAVREKLAKELSEEGFPRPGVPPKIPPMVVAQLVDEGVVVTFSGIPASRPFKPFDGKMKAGKVSIVALSKDGQRVAVRVTSKAAPTEFGVASEVRAVELFK